MVKRIITPIVYYEEDRISTKKTIKKATRTKFIYIEPKLNSIEDLIKLGESYKGYLRTYPATKWNLEFTVDMITMSKLVEPLKELSALIGMKHIKDQIFDQIIYHIQKFDDSRTNMLHTVIVGNPGVGKTTVAKILGKIYLNMGILKNDKFIIAKRSELIGKYLGHTAVQTQKIIDSAIGGVLFIDEAYSLGNDDLKDSFSKEAIDTINQNLSEKAGQFICIIAGYEKEIEECFFAYNPGLKRRFNVKFTIKDYTHEDLAAIFRHKITEINWKLHTNAVVNKFFEEKKKYFLYNGGDIDTLLHCCKVAHGKRVFGLNASERKIITTADIQLGFEKFLLESSSKREVKDAEHLPMYI